MNLDSMRAKLERYIATKKTMVDENYNMIMMMYSQILEHESSSFFIQHYKWMGEIGVTRGGEVVVNGVWCGDLGAHLLSVHLDGRT